MKILNFIKKCSQGNSFPTFIVLLMMVMINFLLQPNFFSPDILKSNITTFAPLILVSMAQAIVIIAGGIDLSIGASITLINVILASMMKDTGSSILLAIVCGFAVSIIVGIINGVSIGYLRLPAMVSTFATSAVWYGISLLIMPQPGGYVPDFFYRLYSENLLYVIPVPLFIVILAFAFWYFIKTRKIYRYIFATGGNEESASANGINISLTKVLAFVISSVLVAIAAIIVTAQTASGDAHVGQAFTLNSVAAAVIGGVSLQGGKGNMLGAAMGACVLGLLINVIFFANIPSMYQDFIKGFIIIIALAIAVLPKLRRVGL